ncbi:MAG TPA: hypothetical protein PKX78_00515, partial [Candidatus Woesebacteria bacterium]|nr:hypothetical protein [Candidatus Woesebacteria bacterium]
GATNPIGVIDLTPELSAIYRDSDAGDTANKYRIQVDDNSDFSSVFWDTGVSGTSMTNCTVNTRCQDISYSGSALTRGTVYYWRIKFWDIGGAEGVFSSVTATFKLNQLPNTPTNASPTNGGTEQSQNPTLQSSAFSDSDVGDTHSNSQWQVSTASGAGFDAAIVWDSGVTATNKTSVVVNSTNGTFQGSLSGQTQLALNSTYYWRVRHQDDKTEWSSYSTITSFTTIVSNPPTAPTIPWCEGQTNPTNVSNLTPSFSAIHNDPDGDAANFYQIEVNTNSSFSGTVMWNSTKTSMSNLASGVRSADFVYAGSGLQLSTTYYWRIRFWDVNGYEGAVSATQQFTTASFVSGNFFFEGLQMEGLNIN